ncbi:aminoacyl-tRNA hydrolase [Aquibacillus salsiterrae]|uniref:peptidyl-tRNA hydrolase n=1 Tax=Aquibacillus salsiterrae TaxID=2950439 RepID=A0A9X3WCK0_9BACI|nr:aminoacyl-tRNA hydrolase [Aquibacillus salsiterrae]MDC3415455.1 peptidyl-tRNA hydrolase [Aquibacillus salsiterrae]
MKDIVQYFVVNGDLTMSPGKVAAQVAHAATQSVFAYHKNADYAEWLESGQTKIILKANEASLIKLKDDFIAIRDAGKTEIEPGSLTVVCLPPMEKEKAKVYTSKFSLYK